MKKLDRIGRLENRILQVGAFGLATGLIPIIGVFIADRVWLHKLDPWLRYSLWVVGGLGLFGITFAVMDEISKAFAHVRRRFGLKPLAELEREISDEKHEAEWKASDSKRRWIETCPDGEYRYHTWLEQQRQFSQLRAIAEMLRFIVGGTIVGTVALALVLVSWAFFPSVKNSAIGDCNFEATRAGIATAPGRPILSVFSTYMASKGYRSDTDGFLRIAQDGRPGDWESKSYEAYLSPNAWTTIWPWEPRRPTTYELIPAK